MDIEWLDDVVAEHVVEADRLAPDGQARERVRRCQCSAQRQVEPDLHPFLRSRSRFKIARPCSCYHDHRTG